jgi:hypothetical protein
MGGAMPLDPSQAVFQKCKCGCELYEKRFRIGVVSRLASRNRTGQDVRVDFEAASVCIKCGAEFGVEQAKDPESKQ